eukprot:347057_1
MRAHAPELIHTDQTMLTFFTLFILVPSYLTQWILSPLQLPRSISRFAIGSNEDRIFMIGGYPVLSKQLIYDTTNNKFTDNGTSVLSHNNVDGLGSFYTQIGNTLYMKAGHNIRISIYNLLTNQFTYHWSYTSHRISSYGECLASTQDYLFITGGIFNGCQNKVQMLDISTKEWTIVSDMNEIRAHHSCIIVPTTNILFVIAGYNCNNHIRTIETIDTNNINNKTWTYYSSNLYAEPLLYTKSVWYNDKIFVIGGYHLSNTMHIINTMDGTISTEPGPYSAKFHGVIIVDSILYVFGGDNGSGINGLNNWAYYNLQTSSHTLATNNPTILSTNPTKIPSNYPTLKPTNPTIDPTNKPINYPSTNPTKINIPTLSPTLNQTMYVTLTSSATPTKYSTSTPTKYPTSTPTKYPTYTPTKYPTYSPTKIQTMDPVNISTTFALTNNTKRPTSSPKPNPSTVYYNLATSSPIFIASMYIIVPPIFVVIVCCIVLRIKKKRNDDKDILHDVEVSHEMEQVDKPNKVKNRNETFSEGNIAASKHIVPSAPDEGPLFYHQVEMDEFDKQIEGHFLQVTL